MKFPRPFIFLIIAGAVIALVFFTSNNHPGEESLASVGRGTNDSPASEVEGLDQNLKRVLQGKKLTGDPSDNPVSGLKILDGNGKPVSNAKVLMWNGSQVLPQLLSDNNGVCSFPDHIQFSGLAVLVEGHYPAFFALDFQEGIQQVQLPSLHSLSGHVSIQNANTNPITHLSLRIQPQSEAVKIPRIVLARMEMKTIVLPIDEAGGFQLLGLPEGWRGSLSLPKTYFLCSYDGPGTVDRYNVIHELPPVDGLMLNFMSLPGFSGRVVSSDRGTGIPKVRVLANVEFEKSMRKAFFYGATSDSKGNFFIPIYPNDDKEKSAWCKGEGVINPTEIELSLDGPKEFSPGEFKLDLSAQADPWFLGNLQLQESVPMLLKVMDENGVPLTDAFAVGSTTADADSSGNILISFEGKGEEVKVFAKGYAPEKFWASPDAKGPLEIKMQKTPSLTCKLILPEGATPAGLKIRIAGPNGLLVDSLETSHLARYRERFQSPRIQAGQQSSGDTNFLCTLEEDDVEVYFWGFQSGIPVSCTLQGLTREPLVTFSDLIFSEGEDKSIVMDIQSSLGRVFGTITNQAGEPVGGAPIQIYSEKGWGSLRSKEDGSFNLIGLSTDPISISVGKIPYPVSRIEDIVPTEEGTFLSIQLNEPRTLDVYFVTPEGHSFNHAVIAYFGGFKDRTHGDAQRISRVPIEEFELRWRLGNLDGVAVIPPHVSEFQIELPFMGSVELQINAKSSQDFRSLFFIPEPTSQNVPDGLISRFNFYIFPGKTSVEFFKTGFLEGTYKATLQHGRAEPFKFIDLGEIQISREHPYKATIDLP